MRTCNFEHHQIFLQKSGINFETKKILIRKYLNNSHHFVRLQNLRRVCLFVLIKLQQEIQMPVKTHQIPQYLLF